MKPHFDVVAAVIKKADKFFCTQRGKTKYPYTSFKYEFPGGKMELGELPQGALEREIREELGIDVIVNHLILQTSYDYPDFSVTLQFFLCSLYDSSHIILLEHNNGVWATVEEMKSLDWVMADRLLIDQWEDLSISPL